jgi:hypothetical protein
MRTTTPFHFDDHTNGKVPTYVWDRMHMRKGPKKQKRERHVHVLEAQNHLTFD